MADYKIYLVKIGKVSIDEDVVKTRLVNLFNQVITQGKVSGFKQAIVIWSSICPSSSSIKNHELLIYICDGQLDSVVSTYFSTNPGACGTTSWKNNVTGSEVYVKSCKSDANLVANVAFHEALHNKGHWSDRLLHGNFGGGGLASATVSAETTLTPKNIKLMASVIKKRRLQWTGGCKYFTDPLRGVALGVGMIRSGVRRSLALFRGPVRGVARQPRPLGTSTSRNASHNQKVANNRRRGA
jgi:hypothetical protein